MVEEKLSIMETFQTFETIVPISYGTLSPYKDNIGIKFHEW